MVNPHRGRWWAGLEQEKGYTEENKCKSEEENVCERETGRMEIEKVCVCA